MDAADRHIAVIGAGRMGSSITDFLVAAGFKVTTVTRTPAQAEAINAKWNRQLERQVKYGLLSQDDMPSHKDHFFATSSYDAISKTDIIIESVNEDLVLKRQVYSRIGRHVKPSTIVASNSSSILPTELAVDGINPARVVGLHFFFPVPVSNIVELVLHPGAAGDTIRRMNRFIESCGLSKIEQNTSNAFLLNMLSMAVGGEAFRGASRFGFSHANELSKSEIFPLGPFSLFDHVGLPVVLAATKRYFERDPLENKQSYEPLMRYMELMLSQEGAHRKFSDLNHPDELPGWTGNLSPLADSDEEFSRRLLFLHINTCLFAVETGLIDRDILDPSIKSIMGTSKGPLELATEIGHQVLRRSLSAYYTETGAGYYRPSSLLEQ